MQITTKANIGDRIYFIHNNSICSGKIKSISFHKSLSDTDTEISYYIETSDEFCDDSNILNCFYEDEIATTLRGILLKLESDYKKNNLVEVDYGY